MEQQAQKNQIGKQVNFKISNVKTKHIRLEKIDIVCVKLISKNTTQRKKWHQVSKILGGTRRIRPVCEKKIDKMEASDLKTSTTTKSFWVQEGLVHQYAIWRFGARKTETEVALFDTLDFLLNEYFIELKTANFNILNKFLNWILSENNKWINFWIDFYF